MFIYLVLPDFCVSVINFFVANINCGALKYYYFCSTNGKTNKKLFIL